MRRVRRGLRGLRRVLGTAPVRQAHPLTVEEVGRIVASIYLGSATGVRDWALILLGYASAMRPSELAALGVADIATRDEES